MNEHGVNVTVVGSIGLDTIETPRERRDEILGGSASYACAAASFFSRVGMVGIVGTDFPSAYTDLYDHFQIDRQGLQVAEGQTFRWSVFADFSPDIPPAYRNAPYLFLANISPDLQLHVLDQVDSPQFVLADTMDLWIEIARDALTEVIRRVHMLTLNESEARHYTGKHNLVQAARELLALGPSHVLIKKGEHGSILFTDSGTFVLPAYPLDHVEDPTGAGDSFAGGLIGALAEEDEVNDGALRRALVHGNIVASFGVEAFSLERFHALDRGDIDDRVNHFRKMIHVPE